MEETAENKLMYTGAEIHPVVEIENPVLNTMYHITGNMALDHSVTSIVQAGGHFYEWMNHSDDLGVPDYGNAADDVWHMDAGDVNPVHGADDVADVNTGHVGQANAGGVTHLDDADNVAGVSTGQAQQQANVAHIKGDNTSKYLEQLDNLSESKINHIINGSKNSNHGWEKVIPDKNWNDIKNIIAKVMDTGVEGAYKSVFSKKGIINGIEVEVTYTKLGDGTIRISDAWVNQ